jgi:hypothetical protein
VLRRRHEVNALVKATKTAKKFAAEAREKRAALMGKKSRVRKNDQSTS